MDEQPRQVILQHPTREWLQVVVTEEMAAMLLRLDLGYVEIIEEPVDELPDKTMREDEE